VTKLTEFTKTLSDQSENFEQVLHITPHGLANFYNIYNPDTGMNNGVFTLNQLSNPVQMICSSFAAIDNITAAETGKLCAQHLGPALRLMNFNYMPLPFNLLLSKAASPENVIYTDPALIPCHRNFDKTCEGNLHGTVQIPPEPPPAISAFTGLPGDDIPNWGPGAFWAPPPPPPPRAASLPPESSALAQLPGPPTVPDLLLPTERQPR
ncbi:MAG TPA: mammalian cell entry protein, partial [Mycobacterium sp.]|nr:mammalian cell entry protein [Mycobacterium sp.]